MDVHHWMRILLEEHHWMRILPDKHLTGRASYCTRGVGELGGDLRARVGLPPCRSR